MTEEEADKLFEKEEKAWFAKLNKMPDNTKVKTLRKMLKFTLKEFSEAAAVNEKTIRRWEKESTDIHKCNEMVFIMINWMLKFFSPGRYKNFKFDNLCPD